MNHPQRSRLRRVEIFSKNVNFNPWDNCAVVCSVVVSPLNIQHCATTLYIYIRYLLHFFPFLGHCVTVDNNLLSWMFFSRPNSKIRLCSRDIWTYMTHKWTHYARYTTAFISWFCSISFIFFQELVPSFLVLITFRLST